MLADFNKDTNLDVTGGWDNPAVYLGNGGSGGTMSWTESSSGLISGGHYTGVDATDFNKDGSIDLIISSYSGGGLIAYKNVNNAASWVSTSTGLPKSGGYMDVTAADFNSDGNPDVATAGYDPGGRTGIHVFYGDGAGNWTEESSGLPTTNSYAGCDSGDFDNDGKIDVVLGRHDGGGIDVYRNTQGAGPLPPTISSTNPANDASNVPKNTKISITFSVAMDHTPTESAISASPSIMGSFAWDGTSKTVTWTPSADLQANVKHTIGISTAAKSKDGMGLQLPYSFSFTTGTSTDTIPPSVSSTSPTNNKNDVDPGAKITITFNEGMDQTASSGAISIAPGSIAGRSWTDNKTIVLTAQLEGGKTYIVTISTGAKDLAGNAMQNTYTLTFTTKSGGGGGTGIPGPGIVALILIALLAALILRKRRH
jgi:hypothetical protein